MGFKRVSNLALLNILIISLFIVGIIITIVALYLSKKRITTVQGVNQNTVTGLHMPCSTKNTCQTGLNCVQTSVGNVCLSDLGGVCTQIVDCTNDANFCNGRCVAETGNLGDFCSTQADCLSDFVCAFDNYSNTRRCLIAQDSPTVCTSFYDCVPGSICQNGQCLVGQPPMGLCSNSLECAGTDQCLDGLCQPNDISSRGVQGSYCQFNAPGGCNEGLECNGSEMFNLPPGIGYCSRPISGIGGICNRFNGCIPIGNCNDFGFCNAPVPINSCAENDCSVGFTCVGQDCKAEQYVTCSVNSDCLSGTCTQLSVQQLIVGGSQNLYSWGNGLLLINNENEVSITESSTAGVLTTTFYTFEQNTRIFYQNGIPFFFSFSSDISRPANVNVKNLKVYQNGRVLMLVTISPLSPPSPSYDKIFNFSLGMFLLGIDTNIFITQEMYDPYPFGITNIQFNSYDYLSNYSYFIIDGKSLYTVTDSEDVEQLFTSTDPQINIQYVAHYTVNYNTGFSPRSVVYGGYFIRGNADIFGLYLLDDDSFQVLIERNVEQIGLNWTAFNTVQRFKMAYTYLDGSVRLWKELDYGSFFSNTQIPGSDSVNNIFQSYANPNIFYTITNSCS